MAGRSDSVAKERKDRIGICLSERDWKFDRDQGKGEMEGAFYISR